MANMLILSPLTASSVAVSSGTGGNNLLTPDPKEVWTASSTAAQTITFDFGAAVSIDTVFMGFTNADAAATWTITAGPSTGTENTIQAATLLRAASDAIGPRYHAFYHRTAGPVSHRFWRIATSSTTAAPQAGIVGMGAAFKPTFNREWGAGRRVIDTGSKSRLRGGGFGISQGVKLPGYQWTFGDLTDAEVQTLWALAMNRGETSPVVVCEDPDTGLGLTERLHYGLFDRFEAFERADPNLNRWALSMEGWA